MLNAQLQVGDLVKHWGCEQGRIISMKSHIADGFVEVQFSKHPEMVYDCKISELQLLEKSH